MKTLISQILIIRLIDIINRNYNVKYNIDDVSTIRFTLHKINIWMNDESRFNIKCNILNSIEIKC